MEPLAHNSHLLNMESVVTLPHLGSSTEQTRNIMTMLAAMNLVNGLMGDKAQNIIPELRR